MLSRKPRLAMSGYVSLMVVGCDSHAAQNVQVGMCDGVKFLTGTRANIVRASCSPY